MKCGKDSCGRPQDADGQFLLDFHKPVKQVAPSVGQSSPNGQEILTTEFLTPQDLCRIFHIPLSTQKVWRWQTLHNKPGSPGIPFIKIRKRVLYPKADILAWIYSQQSGTAAIRGDPVRN